MTNAELKEYLRRRLFSGSRYRMDDLIDLCSKVAGLNILPQPKLEEQQRIAAARLNEILRVSSSQQLPHPTDPTVEWSSAYWDFPKVSDRFYCRRAGW
jgi:hypothetical protein